MKKGQRVLVIEPGFARCSFSSESWMFFGELAERVKTSYGKVIEAINFSTPPFKQNMTSEELELCFDGIVLVKILHCPPTYKTEYGVGIFWNVGKLEPTSWTQYGFVCLLSDKEGKRYLRENVLRIK